MAESREGEEERALAGRARGRHCTGRQGEEDSERMLQRASDALTTFFVALRSRRGTEPLLVVAPGVDGGVVTGVPHARSALHEASLSDASSHRDVRSLHVGRERGYDAVVLTSDREEVVARLDVAVVEPVEVLACQGQSVAEEEVDRCAVGEGEV
eukprot:768713-Hanusia_phi.AAC.5